MGKKLLCGWTKGHRQGKEWRLTAAEAGRWGQGGGEVGYKCQAAAVQAEARLRPVEPPSKPGGFQQRPFRPQAAWKRVSAAIPGATPESDR